MLAVAFDPPIERLTPFQTETIALQIINRNRRLTDDLIRNGSCDCSYSLGQKARFRVNIFSQRGHYSIILRKLTTDIPSVDQLNLPPVFHTVAKEKTGLVLVTGATGSGKSTTLAALLNELNETKSIHIVTLEDPVEFVHAQKMATFNQREMGIDFSNFAAGLRAALRQAPKVILVGEMRDRETVEIGMSAAETGHLVMSTLHTIDAGQTINRIVGMFDQEEEKQIRIRLAEIYTLGCVAAPAPENRRRPCRGPRNHGQQPSREGLDRTRRVRRKNVLRDHRSVRNIRLEDFRHGDPGTLREGPSHRRNGDAVLHQQGSHVPRHRRIKKLKGEQLHSGGLKLDIKYGKRI